LLRWATFVKRMSRDPNKVEYPKRVGHPASGTTPGFELLLLDALVERLKRHCVPTVPAMRFRKVMMPL
jgi:hypothetical protein